MLRLRRTSELRIDISINVNHTKTFIENWDSKVPSVGTLLAYTRDRNVWGDRPFYLVKQPQEKWACDFRDDALPLSFQLQVAEVIF